MVRAIVQNAPRGRLSCTRRRGKHCTRSNVVGVGIGEQIVDDKPTGALALKFLVRVKYPQHELSRKVVLPKNISGLLVDVEEVGFFRRFAVARPKKLVKAAATMPNPKAKIRPAQPGCSIGFRDPSNQFTMAGTFGALVKDNKGVYILSNNHVLADESRLPVGGPIFQPGLLDGGNPSTDQVATLTRFIPVPTDWESSGLRHRAGNEQ